MKIDTSIVANQLNQSGIVAYRCEVMHQRLRPFTYQFRYNIMSFLLDIDVFNQRINHFSWLGFNRFQLMSIYTRDFGARDGSHWRDWLTELLKHYGIHQSPKRILLSCMPRCLGYGFNPLAMWYAYDDNDKLIAVIAEVSNTFGHFHHYVLSDHGNAIDPMGKKLKATAKKAFHVSPFLSMSCRYHFSITLPQLHTQKPYAVHIRESEDNIDTLIATQSGQPTALPTEGFGMVRLGYWLTSFKTIAAIHWWAVKIIIKGGRFHRTPKSQRQKKYSGHSKLYVE